MVLPSIPIRSLYESDGWRWSYDTYPRTPGAFRAVRVSSLQRTPGTIELYEWSELRNGNDEVDLNDVRNYPGYAAISHTWDMSAEVQSLANAFAGDLEVLIEDGVTTISWLGLRQAANAAAQLHCAYMWLDFFSLDQVPRRRASGEDDGEKGLQIRNMGNIYKLAKTVIVMPGGVSAVQGVEFPTSWIDRAWTLQEAVLCKNPAWAYVQWPHKLNFPVGKQTFNFTQVKAETNPETLQKDRCLIRLLRLLEMADLSRNTAVWPSGVSQVKCLDGRATGAAQGKARSALIAVFRGKGGTAGVWRSMLIYSVMGIFNVELDPYQQDRSVQYLYNDLATKMAARGDPGWLAVGGLAGSRISRYPKSGLIPWVPIYRDRALPAYKNSDGETLLSGEFIDGSANYIQRFDIKFVTSSRPHIMCARMFSYNVQRFIMTNPYGALIFLSIGRLNATCTFRGELGSDPRWNRIVIVGTIASWSTPPTALSGSQYVLLLSWKDQRWTVTGDGWFRLHAPGVLPTKRQHFIIGPGAPNITTWSCDHGPTVSSWKRLPRSYGILAKPDMILDERIPIVWFGYKVCTPVLILTSRNL
jgi:hypothetical protein